MHAILNDDPRAASDITPSLSPAIERIVHRCLEKSPDRRFQSASDLAFALEALSDSAIGSSNADRTRKKGNAVRRTAIRAVVGVVLMGVALFTYLWSRPEPAARVSNYVQLTHDGHPKTLVGTDGSRLYFSLGYFDIQGIGKISVACREPIKIPTPTARTTATDISPDGSELLVIDKGGFGVSPFSVALREDWERPVARVLSPTGPITIHNCKLIKNSGAGVSAQGSSNVTIQMCEAWNSGTIGLGGSGISVNGGTQNVQVTNNTVLDTRNPSYGGIVAGYSSASDVDGTILHNVVHGLAQGIALGPNSSNFTVENNDLTRNRTCVLNQGTNNTILDNIC